MKKLIDVQHLKKHYIATKGFVHKKTRVTKAVDDISFYVNEGETLGVVGESGCGKTTTGKCLLRLVEPTDGNIFFGDKDITKLAPQEMRYFRNKMQIVFQDAMYCLDPRWKIGLSLTEAVENLHPNLSAKEVDDTILHFISKVGLKKEDLLKYPHEFSGGQRQRIGIAKALCVQPQFVVCDEPVSALDVSIQAQILNLFLELKKEFNLSYLFVSHDLAVIKYVSDRILVMYMGTIVEIATKEELFKNPLHPYTHLLLDSILDLHQEKQTVANISGEPIQLITTENGCPFYHRCKYATKLCANELPALLENGTEHYVACHNVANI